MEREGEAESAGLVADGNMFYGPDDRPVRRAPRTAWRPAEVGTSGIYR